MFNKVQPLSFGCDKRSLFRDLDRQTAQRPEPKTPPLTGDTLHKLEKGAQEIEGFLVKRGKEFAKRGSGDIH